PTAGSGDGRRPTSPRSSPGIRPSRGWKGGEPSGARRVGRSADREGGDIGASVLNAGGTLDVTPARRDGHVPEGRGKLVQAGAEGLSAQGGSVAGDRDFGLQGGKGGDGGFGLVPVLRVVHGRAMEERFLDRDGVHRFLRGGDEGVSGDQRAI